jgi:hypothetical protein
MAPAGIEPAAFRLVAQRLKEIASLPTPHSTGGLTLKWEIRITATSLSATLSPTNTTLIYCGQALR